jgi:nicotinamidase-related amidase
MNRRLCLILVGWSLLAAPAVWAAGEKAPASPKGKPALLVIDIQNAFLPMVPETDRKIGLYVIDATIKLFRENGLPVVRVYHTEPGQGPLPGTEAFEFPSSVGIKPDDPKVVKNFPSGFKKTDLDKILKEQGVDTVFLVGLSSVGCVLATYFDARTLDYQAFMVKDAVMSHRTDLTRAVEEITEATSYDVVKYVLDRSKP